MAIKYVFNPFTGNFDAINTGGGGGTPASPSGSIQYNNSGVFGGSENATLDAGGNANFQGVITTKGGNSIDVDGQNDLAFYNVGSDGRTQFLTVNGGSFGFIFGTPDDLYQYALAPYPPAGQCYFDVRLPLFMRNTTDYSGADIGDNGGAYYFSSNNPYSYYVDSWVAGNGGNFGVGTSSPAYLLDVNGSIHGADYYAASGNEGISTTVTSASLVGKTITIENGLITGFA